MEMFERAFAMFTPFARREEPGAADPEKSQSGGSADEIHDLKRQMAEMQKRLDAMMADAKQIAAMKSKMRTKVK